METTLHNLPELAQELEAVHGWCIGQYAAALARLRPEVNSAVLPICGGHAIYTGPTPFSFAVGLAMRGPISAAELDEVERFYMSRGSRVAVDVCPFTHPSLAELLIFRGYRVEEFTSVLVRDMRSGALPPPPTRGGIDVRWATPEDCDQWVDTIIKCLFVSHPGLERRRNMTALFQAPNSLCCLAFVNGEIAGVAGGMVPPNGGIATFFGSCTLPDFRRRGVHAALLDLRLQAAKEAGCKMVAITTLPGSDSERNLIRHGFTPCYLKETYVLKPEPL